ncbi:hypothetical protein L914_18804 [Phytophthora nicotianae]|uniref:HTH CENPB-type domain-containing protein n=1 Tax=Phytophthora nicotianae TaxID=4792 RepID=W2MCF8_PHYNI|nr:hypothetical protein L914_18804 [Phytophthora nicotianae]
MADDILLLKARELAERFNIDAKQLRLSNGWLQKFKKRNGIRSHTLCGEGGTVEDDAARDDRLQLQEVVTRLILKMCSISMRQLYSIDLHLTEH